MRKIIATVSTLTAVPMIFALVGPGVAAASEPAGIGAELSDLRGEGTAALTAVGTYSCQGEGQASFTITATDTDTHATSKIDFTRPCPATGRGLADGKGRDIPHPAGQRAWGKKLTVQISENGPGVTQNIHDSIAVTDGRPELVTVDGVERRPDGTIVLRGQLTCATAGPRQLKTRLTETAQGGTTTTDTTCRAPGAKTPWTATITPTTTIAKDPANPGAGINNCVDVGVGVLGGLGIGSPGLDADYGNCGGTDHG